jgi:hypothetical protein
VLFDATALVALMRGHDEVYDQWDAVRRTGAKVVIPATAILMANREMGLKDGTWEAVLEDDNAVVLALTASNALTASRCSGDVATAHATVEAIDTGATIVTSMPIKYRGQRLWVFN